MNTHFAELLNAVICIISIYAAFLRFNFGGPLGTISNVQGVLANMKIVHHVSNKNDKILL